MKVTSSAEAAESSLQLDTGFPSRHQETLNFFSAEGMHPTRE